METNECVCCDIEHCIPYCCAWNNCSRKSYLRLNSRGVKAIKQLKQYKNYKKLRLICIRSRELLSEKNGDYSMILNIYKK